MRGLKAAVILMGVLIVAGVVVLAVALGQKFGTAVTGGALAGPVLLDEPAGTRIASSAVGGERVVLQLAGGGPDRVVIYDLARARVVGRISLVH